MLNEPCLDTQWTNLEVFHTCKSFDWNEASKLTHIPVGQLKNISGNVAKILSQTGSFPQRKQIHEYETPELKVFCRVWKESPATIHVSQVLGISPKKATGIANYLRQRGVPVPELEGEHVKAKEREQFDWMKFAQVIKGAITLEFAAETLDMSAEDIIECCLELQALGINCQIPPYDETPEWIMVRMGRELQKIIFRGDLHGGGRNYKIRHAGYKKQFKMSFGESKYLVAMFNW